MMNREITHLPEDFSWYNKETKEVPYIPKSLNPILNQNK
jgi:hypothetical protein